MTKVLLIQNTILEYRIPIYNLLAMTFDLTVIYSYEAKLKYDTILFKIIKIPTINIGRFKIHKANLHHIASKYDLVIGMNDISWLSIMSLGFLNRKFKLIYWGIGVSTNPAFDSKTKWDFIRYFFNRKADALLFYSNYPINKYIKRGFKVEALFVANNTVPVYKESQTNNEIIKDSILFIGNLSKRKKIYSILSNYYYAYKDNKNIFDLNIIGNGAEYNNISNWINEHNLNKKINILGELYEESILSKYFKKAIACVSPGQAGLSVLKSMGYGVPFITMNNSITGGERFNITNDINGILYKDEHDLKKIFIDMTTNPKKFLDMGINAKRYYDSNRTIEQMLQGFINAIDYCLTN